MKNSIKYLSGILTSIVFLSSCGTNNGIINGVTGSGTQTVTTQRSGQTDTAANINLNIKINTGS